MIDAGSICATSCTLPATPKHGAARWRSSPSYATRLSKRPGSLASLPRDDLEQIARRENGAPIGSRVLPADLPEIGHWAPLEVPQDDVKGKYNALLRLPDVDNRPAVTLTTLRSLALGAPTDEYRELIARAVGHPIPRPNVGAGQPNSRFLPPVIEVDVSLAPGGSPGVRMTTLPISLRPDGEVMLMGEASSSPRRWESWVRFDESVKARRSARALQPCPRPQQRIW